MAQIIDAFSSVMLHIYRQDVSFLMPRTATRFKPTRGDTGDLEGKAVILLSTFIYRSVRNKQNVEDCKSEPATECGSSGFALDSIVLTRLASEGATEDSFASLDLPLDAYVTPGCGKRVECCLPVVCAADEEEIEALVTSVVCQRYVWNIPLPVVGISLSTSGTTAAIVVGWSEVNAGSPDSLVGVGLFQVVFLH